MKKNKTPTPWYGSDMNPCAVYRDSQGVVDRTRPVANFLHVEDADFAVMACNNHKALVKAAAKAHTLIGKLGLRGAFISPTEQKTVDALVAILETVGGN